MNTSRTPPSAPADSTSPRPLALELEAEAQREWLRQETARRDDTAPDPLYRALARAAAAPPRASLPPDFAARMERRVRRADAGDRFEIGLLAGILVLGGLLALGFALPVLAEIAGSLRIELPEAPQAGLPWALLGAAALALSGLLSGAIERLHQRS
jgi:hypothetical protein